MTGAIRDETGTITHEPLLLELDVTNCLNHADYHSRSPHISCYYATIYLPEQIIIGSIAGQLLGKATMEAISSGTMWEECQAFDASHAPASKLDKVENYLSNECFPPDKQALIDEAKSILFRQEIYIEPRFRGRGRSLRAIDLLMQKLEVQSDSVVLLQAAAIVSYMNQDEGMTTLIVDTHEKIARHWKRMGFDEWSWTDDAWLCLSANTENRPNVLPNLFNEGSKDCSADG